MIFSMIYDSFRACFDDMICGAEFGKRRYVYAVSK
jgi:hypothetical protein